MSKRMVILGAGESGTGAAILAKAKGYDVFVSDMNPIAEKYKVELINRGISFEQGKHSEELILNADEIVKSPGIPDHAAIIMKVVKKGIKIISEIEFAARYTNAKFVAITGSNGKTTTTLLTYHLLSSSGFNVGLAGNIGNSLAWQVAEQDKAMYVLELSSFQLDHMFEFKADVAVLLNITPDHLDRYDYKFDNYINAKLKITQNQTKSDYLISFADDEVVAKELLKRDIKATQFTISLEERVLNGAYATNDNLLINVHNHITSVFNLNASQLPLNGKHNQVNMMAAILAALSAGASPENICKAIPSFKNAEHRLEEVAVINRVRYVNDSKATNVDSVRYALDAYPKPIIWIAGGVDKGNDYKLIEELVFERVKALVCLGKDNARLKEAFKGKVSIIVESQEMTEAVRLAHELSEPGDTVLLSPACASFDLFKNYEDRGAQFKQAVKSHEQRSKELTLKSIFL